ncbi:MAG: SpaA isopeptide-forming pilin-related protein, partial [Bacilli bacterium]
MATVDEETGELTVNILEGEYIKKTKIENVSQATEQVTLENKPKIILNITKKSEEGTPIEDVRFKITGKGFTTGRTLITNGTGTAILAALYENEIYTLEEVKAEGYYLSESIEFKIVKNDDNTYELEYINETEHKDNIKSITFTENEDHIPVLNLEINNEKIPTYNLEILKVDEDTNEPLSNTQFLLKNLETDEESYFNTDENGLINIEGIYQYAEGKNVLAEYELSEVVASEGYITDNTIYHFRVRKENENLKVEFLSDNSFEYIANEDKIQATLKNAPIFKLQKLDGETTQVLPNTKFAIYKIDEDYNEYLAYDVNGNLVGEEQTIDGVKYQVIITDENGEISLNLPSGLYKVIEIEALENYELPEEIEDRTYYFGIDETVQGSKEWTAESENYLINEVETYNTNDGYVRIGRNYYNSILIPEEETVNNEEIIINPSSAIIIIKYNFENKVEWVKSITSADNPVSLIDTAYSENGEIILASETLSENMQICDQNGEIIKNIELNKTEGYTYNYEIIKINIYTGEIKENQIYTTGISKLEFSEINKDGNVAITIEFVNTISKDIKVSNIKTGEEIVIAGDGSRDQGILCFDSDLDAIWGYCISAPANNWSDAIKATPDGGFISVGTFWNTFTIKAKDTVEGIEDIKIVSHGAYDILFVKFNSEGKIEQTKVFGGAGREYSYDLEITENNEYILVGNTISATITIKAEDTVKNEEIIVSKKSSGYDGYIVKFNEEFKVEWIYIYGNSNKGSCGYRVKKYNEGCVAIFSNIGVIPAEYTVDNKEIILGSNTYMFLALNDEGKVKWALDIENSGKIFKNNDEFLVRGWYNYIKIYQKEILPEVPELQKINVKNYKKKYIILTNSEAGGKISGGGYTPYYEQVSIHENSKKDIIVTPDEGFIIQSIMINDEEIPFETDENGIAVIDKFIDMTEDKYVYARFVEKEYALTINKIDEENNPISDVQFKITKNFEDEIPASNTALGDIYNKIPNLEDEGDGAEYTFVQQEDGRLIPNNLGIENTIAEAYIPIDLTNYKDSYEITINVDGILGTGDRGYLEILEENGDYYGYIGYLSGTIESRDYSSIRLEGGHKYYLALSYYKNSSTTDDTLTINSINLNRSTVERRVPTNGNGQAITTLQAGTWTIEEVETAEGYILNDEKKEIELNDTNNSITIEYVNRKEITPTVIVHHYKENTIESVSEDEVLTGNIDEKYTTSPKMDLEEYEVIVEKIPTNASGVYTEEVQEVVYYYKEREVTLTVHHYLEGTTQEISSEGYELKLPKGEEYVTEAATDLNEKYELITLPANSTGILTENTVVNYYYKIKTFNVVTKVEENGGNILGENESPYEIVEYGKDSIKEIIATPEIGYKVSKITINGEEIEFTENEDKTVTINNFVNMTEDKEVIVTFERITGTVIVHHYEEETENSIAPDEEKTGLVGDIFATKPSEEIPEYYELSSSSEITSGIYTEEIQEVIYYYKLKEYQYQVEYYYDGELDEEKTDMLNAAYGTEIGTYENKIIDGYEIEKEENIPLTISIDETQNIIKIYYIKKTDLSYTVNYLEKDTNKIIHDSKTVENQTFESIIISSSEIIEIAGYNYDSIDKDTLTISTGLNEINIYYTKKDTKVTVHYYE